MNYNSVVYALEAGFLVMCWAIGFIAGLRLI